MNELVIKEKSLKAFLKKNDPDFDEDMRGPGSFKNMYDGQMLMISKEIQPGTVITFICEEKTDRTRTAVEVKKEFLCHAYDSICVRLGIMHSEVCITNQD